MIYLSPTLRPYISAMVAGRDSNEQGRTQNDFRGGQNEKKIQVGAKSHFSPKNTNFLKN